MPTNQPPNLLIIMFDEHASMFSGPYGHLLVQTPHMDRLAKDGVIFTNTIGVNLAGHAHQYHCSAGTPCPAMSIIQARGGHGVPPLQCLQI